MIVFAAICPHPPVIVPEVGGQQTSKVKKTIVAMERLAKDFADAEADTIVIISPHGPIFADCFNTRMAEAFRGNLSLFGTPQVGLKLPGNQKLARVIANAATGNNLPTELLFSPELDHGIIVPLYFLLKNLSYSPTLIPIGFSNLPLKDHYQFGGMVARVCQDKLNRIAVIASGDLSHRLTPEAPAGQRPPEAQRAKGGYSPRGREFDEKLIELLKINDVGGIINLDPQLIEEAGECGLRSIVILLGSLTLLTSHFSLLSYEGPFGVGYLVAQVL